MNERFLNEAFEVADFEISDAEIRRSLAHHRHVLGWPGFGFEGATPDQAESVVPQLEMGEVVVDPFLDNPYARTATLGIIRLRRDWTRDRLAQSQLIGPESRLLREYDTRVYERSDPDNRLRISIDAGIVSAQGIAMLTRQRRLAMTQSFEQEFRHAKTGQLYMARLAIVFSKLSTFAFDLEQLKYNPAAAREVYQILMADMVMRSNKKHMQHVARSIGVYDDELDPDENDLDGKTYSVADERAYVDEVVQIQQKMAEYNISADAVLLRVARPNPLSIQSPDTVAAIESSISHQTGLLIPSTSTFYGGRVIKSLSR